MRKCQMRKTCRSVICMFLQYFRAAVLGGKKKPQPHFGTVLGCSNCTNIFKVPQPSACIFAFQDGEGNPIDIQIKSKPDGVFACSYVPVKPIKHTISVVWGGANVPNSPFRVSTEVDITSSNPVGYLCSQLLVITTRMMKPFCDLQVGVPFCSPFFRNLST